jgi:hypothetical protein
LEAAKKFDSRELADSILEGDLPISMIPDVTKKAFLQDSFGKKISEHSKCIMGEVVFGLPLILRGHAEVLRSL